MTFGVLGDVADLISGQHIESTLYSRVGGATPYLTGPADFTARHPHVSKWTNAPKVFARVSDVLVTVKGAGVGKVNWGCDAAIGRQLMAIRPKADLLEQSYLFHFLRSQEQRLNGLAQGATVPGIGRDDLLKLRIPTPPVREQRRIAEILDKADALRAKRRAALAQLDALTQSIFLDMFGDPAANARGWTVVRLAELFATPPVFGTMIPANGNGGDWLSLRVANIQDWRLDLSDKKFVDLPANDVARHTVADGDLLMARAIASEEHLGKCVVAYPAEERWAFDSHLVRIRFDVSKAEPEFIRHMLMTNGGRSIFLRSTRRSAVQFNINTKEISALRLPIPPIECQRRFLSCLSDIERLVDLQRVSLTDCDALFASLQHRAFRGEL